MKRSNTTSLVIVFAICIFTAMGCSMSSANLSSLKTSTDKAGTQSATTFKSGDTLYGTAAVANNPGDVKVKLYLADSKGETLKGSDVTVDVKGDGTANYSVPVSEEFPAGTYKLHADMMNEAGEKKDSKTVDVTIAE